MLSNISNSFIPNGIYILILLICLVSIIFYFLRIQNDITFSKLKSIQVISIPFYISFGLSLVSLIIFFLPFIEVPIFGGLSLLDIANRSNEDMLYIVPLILMHVFSIIFNGIIAFKKLSFKGAKTENLDLMFSILVIILDFLLFVELNVLIHPIIEIDNTFVNTIKDSFSLGIGIYILLIISSIQLIMAFLSNKFSSQSVITPINQSESINISELRELKKMVDDGILTQEEFEKRKTKIL